MKIILIDVMSLDGKLTKWKTGPASDWASAEDSVHFVNMIKKNNLLVMGSKTYMVNRPQPEFGRLRIVMTKNLPKYRQYEVPKQLEFTDEEPNQLINRLEGIGYKQMLLVGGSILASAFMKEKLVDELWITIEPKIFANGKSLVEESTLDIDLQLVSYKKLNKRGTLLLKYHVLK